MTLNSLEIIAVPFDAGASCRGAARGPAALLDAGLASELASLGYPVYGAGKPLRLNTEQALEQQPVLEQVVAWCEETRNRVTTALDNDRLPLVLGGDHSLAIGSIAGVANHCARTRRTLCVLWLDAHADFHTPHTSSSGNIHGMPVAVIIGNGFDALAGLSEVRPMLDPDNIYQLGIRAVDQNEKQPLVESGITVFDMRAVDEYGVARAMDFILDQIAAKNAHLHLSFDIDSIDPALAAGTGTKSRGGLSYREAHLCMEMIFDSGLLGSVDLMEVNPLLESSNDTAELAVELLKSLFGNQILPARCHPDLGDL